MPRHLLLRFVVLPALVLFLGGCASARDAEDRPTRPSDTGEVEVGVAPDLSPASVEIATIQLYPDGQEGQMPILRSGQRNHLTLRFDLLAERGRPVSVYFYHADRDWQRDLNPAEYLSGFHRDDILDYSPSEGTEVPFYHYRYQFPNDVVQFRISGNYIVRVTEQGMEDEVLFEMPFFVSEESVGGELGADYLIGTGGMTLTQPVLVFQPPRADAANSNDYSACFIRNGRLEESRCATRASTIEAPALRFYLPREAAFSPEAADLFLRLGSLQVGSQVERIDFSRSPFFVRLEPDYARFGPSGITPLQYGQPVVQAAVRDRARPAVGAEYVDVQFSLVPAGESRYAADVHVIGAFNRWRPAPSNRMIWNSAQGRYEATLMMKQGEYEYTYWSSDRRLRDAMNNAPPRPENAYQAFVYYDDIRVGTHRLLNVTGVATR
ncbi:MAG: type IX secretion system plug protein domain-containing protein [Rhodothermales bacterium]